mmetsp:Transcript_2208/g.5657  ORF Transcript_2208/g.5657 Transcript_2208/m.5657 type:complete len:506 (-) Transcript_2208:19-1536(-)
MNSSNTSGSKRKQPEPTTDDDRAPLSLAEMKRGIMGSDAATQLSCMRQLQQMLTPQNHDPPLIQETIDDSLVTRLVRLLAGGSNNNNTNNSNINNSNNNDTTVQLTAASTLEAIIVASKHGSSDYVTLAVTCGAIPHLKDMLPMGSGNSTGMQLAALRVLGCIGQSSSPHRDAVLNADVVPSIIDIIKGKPSDTPLIRAATKALSHLFAGKPLVRYDTMQPFCDVAMSLMFSLDEEVLEYTCQIATSMSDGPNNRIDSILETGVCMRVVELLSHPSQPVRVSALMVVGNIATGSDSQTQTLLNNGVVPHLRALMLSGNAALMEHACWVVSNLLSGTQEQMEEVLDGDVMSLIIAPLDHEEKDVRKKAAWAIAKSGNTSTSDQMNRLVHREGCIEPWCTLLMHDDRYVVLDSLESLRRCLRLERDALDEEKRSKDESDDELNRGNAPFPMAIRIEEAGGKAAMIKLKDEHTNHDIMNRCCDILEVYFDHHDDEEGQGRCWFRTPSI